jgi:oligoendopeptidase F
LPANETNQTTLPKRSELDPRYTWNLESIYVSLDDWEADFARVSERVAALERLRGTLGRSAAALFNALQERDEVLMAVERLATYSGLRASEDQTNATYIALDDRAHAFLARGAAASAFFEPEIVELGQDAVERFIDELPELGTYRHYFHNLFRRKEHVRSDEVEAVLALASEPLAAFRGTFHALADADLRFAAFEDEQGNTVPLEQNGQYRYLISPDRRVRQQVWERYYDAYLALRNTLAANYAGEVKRNVLNARVRRYPSALDAALSAQNVPPAIYHNLLAGLDRNIGVWQRYFRVLARLLGVERLHGWDLSEQPIPLPGRPQRRYSFEEGVELVLASLAPLGEEYVEIVRQGVRDRWVDVHSNAGKSGGAFSGGAPGTHPFILMNWTHNLSIVSTLSHELGHSLHSYYAWQSQPLVYAWYGDVVSETASNLHQVLLAEHVLRTSDDPDQQISVILERMGAHLRYLFNMILLATFELDCHKRVERGEALTADGMIATLADLYARAYGGTVVLDRERVGIRWATFPHLFNTFYPYSYGAGTAAAAAIGKQILEQGAPAAARYIAMLRAGDSMYQHEAIELGGADLREPATIQAAFDVLSGYVERLEMLSVEC